MVVVGFKAVSVVVGPVAARRPALLVAAGGRFGALASAGVDFLLLRVLSRLGDCLLIAGEVGGTSEEQGSRSLSGFSNRAYWCPWQR